MKSRKKRVCSLLLSSVVFSSLSFSCASGMEKDIYGGSFNGNKKISKYLGINIDKRKPGFFPVSVNRYLGINTDKRRPGFFPGTKLEAYEKKELRPLCQILSIASYLIHKEGGKSLQTRFLRMFNRKLKEDSVEERIKGLEEAIDYSKLTNKDSYSRLELWYHALCGLEMSSEERKEYEILIKDIPDDNKIYQFLRTNKNKKSIDNIEGLDVFTDEEIQSCLKFQKRINGVVYDILHVLADNIVNGSEWVREITSNYDAKLTYFGDAGSLTNVPLNSEINLDENDDNDDNVENNSGDVKPFYSEKVYSEKDFEENKYYDTNDPFIDDSNQNQGEEKKEPKKLLLKKKKRDKERNPYREELANLF